MAVKQSTTENEEKLPISRILDFISDYEQRAISQDYSQIAKHIVQLLGEHSIYENCLRCKYNQNIRKPFIFLGCIDQPKQNQPKLDAKQFTNQIAIIDEFLRKIAEQIDITKICSTALHNVLKMGKSLPASSDV